MRRGNQWVVAGRDPGWLNTNSSARVRVPTMGSRRMGRLSARHDCGAEDTVRRIRRMVIPAIHAQQCIIVVAGMDVNSHSLGSLGLPFVQFPIVGAQTFPTKNYFARVWVPTIDRKLYGWKSKGAQLVASGNHSSDNCYGLCIDCRANHPANPTNDVSRHTVVASSETTVCTLPIAGSQTLTQKFLLSHAGSRLAATHGLPRRRTHGCHWNRGPPVL